MAERTYRVEVVPWGGHELGARDLEEQLNTWAEEGWEVVSILPTTAGTSIRSLVSASASADLYWIPLGAGASVVRISGRTFEALSAWWQRRQRCALYHSALIASTGDGDYVIEMTPIPASEAGAERGVVAEGPVGSRLASRFRIFRYEIRRWRDGIIPDLSYAVSSPVRVTEDLTEVRNVLELVPLVPAPVWGRDELRAGEMWNSNSVISWLLVSAGVDAAAGEPPLGGRAPGWDAGVVVARRDRDRAAD